MPIYVYECPACRTRRELVRPIAEMDDPVFCEARKCTVVNAQRVPTHRQTMRRIPAAPANQFPGADRW